MADYIYSLEHRLSAPQRSAVQRMRELAAERNLTLFLVGGAVRDLTSGSPVRDLDFVVQGNAMSLRSDLEAAGVEVTGEREVLQALYLRMPGGVRAELGSTLSATWPKPGKPVFQSAPLGEDLRRRDFTANAMALSLNEGSYGLLIDPLNGVADIENRQLRLVSNYGFIEEPVRMVRAARLIARFGWTLEEKTQTRYDTGQAEGYLDTLDDFQRGYELEEIVHEEDPMRVLKRLEADGWMKVLAPYWTTAKINGAEMERLRDVQIQLQTQGIATDGGAAAFPLLAAKLTPKELAGLKAGFPRQGFVREIDLLELDAKEFATQLMGKAANAPSAAWKLIRSAKPEAVLLTAFSNRNAGVQAKLKSFLTEWPSARQRIPYATMQEMRIVPETEGYAALVEALFFELMDGRLGTTEEIKAFLEPYSPPAPPPPVNVKRARAAKKEAKPARGRARKEAVESDDVGDADEPDDGAEREEDESETGAKVSFHELEEDEPEAESDEDDEDADEPDAQEPAPAPKVKSGASKVQAAKMDQPPIDPGPSEPAKATSGNPPKSKTDTKVSGKRQTAKSEAVEVPVPEEKIVAAEGSSPGAAGSGRTAAEGGAAKASVPGAGKGKQTKPGAVTADQTASAGVVQKSKPGQKVPAKKVVAAAKSKAKTAASGKAKADPPPAQSVTRK